MIPSEYFKQHMATLRTQMLNGTPIPTCNICYEMEQHNKVSGRQRQLLKVGVLPGHFAESLAASTFRLEFDYSAANSGATTSYVQDWQIDLGNYCNSQCVMCSPASSSKLATEFKSLGLIESTPPRAWCDDPVLLERFCKDITSVPSIRYLHFIGGETLIVPGFKRILSALVESGRAADITVGFTTNLTIWDESITALLSCFKNTHLGLSIETLDPVNDYIRYPSKIARTRELLDQWVELGRSQGWLTQLRITPTALSVGHLISVYEYAYQHNLAVESCNFLENPPYLRISVLPDYIRERISDELAGWVDQHSTGSDKVVNTRDPNHAQDQIVQDAQSYVNFLRSAPDETHRLPDLVGYLKLLESSRKNSILDYVPEYEELLRTNGY